jgi:hypothetical protein
MSWCGLLRQGVVHNNDTMKLNTGRMECLARDTTGTANNSDCDCEQRKPKISNKFAREKSPITVEPPYYSGTSFREYLHQKDTSQSQGHQTTVPIVILLHFDLCSQDASQSISICLSQGCPLG